MRRRYLIGFCTALGFVAANVAAQAAPPSDLCVGGPQPGCFATLQEAVDAAHDGDTIRLAHGTFAGGVTIDKSVSLVGASAHATKIEGGGPVITIGNGTADLEVSISRVTISGGFNDSRPDGFFTAGGGVLITAAAHETTGATVTISDSVISANRVTAVDLQPLCNNPCAFASGGGIANWGTLTVTGTRVDGNVAGSTPASAGLATDARGGGIWNSSVGAVTLHHSVVTGNRVAVSAPNGRFAEGGGIDDEGTLTVEDSIVDRNAVEAATAVASSFPFDVQQEATAGGIRLEVGSKATITRSSISDNVVTSTNLGGDAQAVAGAMDMDGTLLLVDSRVDHNRVSASVPPASEFLAGAVFGGLEVQNAATIRRSSISHNELAASSAAGAVNVAGAGIGNLSGDVALERVRLVGNHGTASGAFGLAIGGGIVNTSFGGGPPNLAVSDSVVSANRLDTAPGITPQGGGIFSADVFTGDAIPFTLTHTVIAGNEPDQCVGC